MQQYIIPTNHDHLIKRNFDVWVLSLGVGIPILNLVAMWNSEQRLEQGNGDRGNQVRLAADDRRGHAARWRQRGTQG